LINLEQYSIVSQDQETLTANLCQVPQLLLAEEYIFSLSTTYQIAQVEIIVFPVRLNLLTSLGRSTTISTRLLTVVKLYHRVWSLLFYGLEERKQFGVLLKWLFNPHDIAHWQFSIAGEDVHATYVSFLFGTVVVERIGAYPQVSRRLLTVAHG
jgi:hypothetical protein